MVFEDVCVCVCVCGMTSPQWLFLGDEKKDLISDTLHLSDYYLVFDVYLCVCRCVQTVHANNGAIQQHSDH